MKKLEEYVITIPDFPEEGIMFRDVTGILQEAEGLQMAISAIDKMLEGVEFDLIAAPESRGFIFGVPVAYNQKKPFAPIRKKGKLPRETVEVEYELEYGKAVMEIHKDAVRPGQKVVIIDDLLATGGTTEAMIRLVESLGGEVVKLCFVIELAGLNGRDKVKGYEVESALIYEGK